MKKGFKKKNYYFEDASGSYAKAMSEYKFRKAWNLERRRRVLEQKVCLYCEKEFKGDKGAVLHHRKMQELEAEAKEKVFWVKRDAEIGQITKDKKDEMIKNIENELIEYYRSLKETDLICVKCHADVHSGKEIAKNYVQRKLV